MVFPGIAKGFIKGALPLGYHTKQIPCKTGCDYNECKNSQTNIDAVFPCGHGYHINCLISTNFQCKHCYIYLENSIQDLAALYNERLEMDGNIGDEFDSPQDETIEEDDTNIPETISLGDKLDKCLHKTLRGILIILLFYKSKKYLNTKYILKDFIENKPLDIFQPINKNKTSTVKKQKKSQKPLKTITNCYQEQT